MKILAVKRSVSRKNYFFGSLLGRFFSARLNSTVKGHRIYEGEVKPIYEKGSEFHIFRIGRVRLNLANKSNAWTVGFPRQINKGYANCVAHILKEV